MNQHPVPQNVTQYQFRLVGDMTLKQFLELAGGLLLGYLIYISNLIFIIKLPLAGLSALLGIGMAFFPVEERPLDQWIVNFFKAIYSPTVFVWKKTNPTIDIFKYQPQQQTAPQNQIKQIPTPQTNIMASFEETEKDESELLTQINNLIDQFPPLSPILKHKSSQQTIKPQTKISVRKLKQHSISINPTSQTKNIPPSLQPTPPQLNTTTSSTTTTTNPINSTDPQNANNTEFLNPTQSTPLQSIKPTDQQQEFVIYQKPTVTKEDIKPIQQTATTTNKLPLKPQKPNIVTGIVTDSNNKIIPNIVIEILDESGTPQRATKTNALGQFSISTPLQNGEYIIQVDDNDISIPAQKILAKGEIIDPIHLHP